MTKTSLLLFILLIGGAATAFAMSNYAKTWSWNYRVTVEINTPEGLKTGSVVRQVQARLNSAKIINPDINPISYKLIGEAVTIDLDDRGILFSLLNNFSHLDVPNAFPMKLNDPVEFLDYYDQIDVGSKSELKKDLPGFITFSDLNVPTTIKGTGIPIMSDVLGQGVSFNKIIIEITDDPVTWGIEKYLPWLPSRKNTPGYIGGESKYPFKNPTNTHVRGTNLSKGRFW